MAYRVFSQSKQLCLCSLKRNIAIWELLDECSYTRARDMVYAATHVRLLSLVCSQRVVLSVKQCECKAANFLVRPVILRREVSYKRCIGFKLIKL